MATADVELAVLDNFAAIAMARYAASSGKNDQEVARECYTLAEAMMVERAAAHKRASTPPATPAHAPTKHAHAEESAPAPHTKRGK